MYKLVHSVQPRPAMPRSCGSSREHAPVALGASGATVVVAESYARIFFRNCVST